MKESITEKIKSFESACETLGIDPKELPAVDNLPEKDRKSIIAYYKLIIIARALNEGWEPNWADYDEWKYMVYYYTRSGSGFVDSSTATYCTDTSVGSRLCFKSRELAEYAKDVFQELYLDYMFINKPQVE